MIRLVINIVLYMSKEEQSVKRLVPVLSWKVKLVAIEEEPTFLQSNKRISFRTTIGIEASCHTSPKASHK